MTKGGERTDHQPQRRAVGGNGQTTQVSGNGNRPAKAPERPKYGPPASGGGPRWGQARPVEKSLHFFPSLKRLLGHLAPERMVLTFAVLLAIAGIVMNVLGPKILGMATDVIFTGVLGKNLPSGATKEQVVAGLRAQGNGNFANMVERLDVVPGEGIDFTLLGHLLLLALVLYLWVAFYVTVRRTVAGLDAAAQRMIGGDMTQAIQLDSRDELGDVARSFNTVASALISSGR